MFFSKKESEINTTVQEKIVGLVIQFTPIAIYVYNVIDDFPEVSDGVISIYDMDDNLIEISGTYISFELPETKVSETKRKYGLHSTSLPIIELECKLNI